MKHNLHKMLCLLLVAVLLWGTLPAALAIALPVDTGQAAESAPEAESRLSGPGRDHQPIRWLSAEYRRV